MKFRIILPLAALLPMMAAWPLSAGDFSFIKLNERQQVAEDILRELVSFESTVERPDEVLGALQAVEKRLLKAGFDATDVQLLTPSENNHGLVVRYRSMGAQKPLLLLAHIDVVTAVADDWTFPPFELGSDGGFYLGRGTDDNKAGVAQIVSNLVRLKNEAWVPGRDIIAAITGNEETTQEFAEWLANEGRHLVDAGLAINSDAGWGEYDAQGKPLAFWIQTSEKIYQTYRLTARNAGGHSSQPRSDNAIRDLAQAIIRLTDYQFPIEFNDGTRMEFRRSAAMYPDQIARDMRTLLEDESNREAAERLTGSDPAMNAILRTTCVPTVLTGGHANNALPREASVTVNCRILPGTRAVDVERQIMRLVDGLGIGIETVWEGVASDVSVLPSALMEQIESLVEARWGEVPVIPSMSTGTTDGLFFRNMGIPVYGISALFSKPGDSGAHGLNEKIGVREFHESVAFWHELLTTLAR